MALPPRTRIMLIFAVYAVPIGGLFSRIAEVQMALGLSKAAFGVALGLQPLGILLGTLVAAAVTDALGTRRTLLAVFAGSAFTPVLIGFAQGFWTLSAAMFVFGLVQSFGGIALNVEADRVAHATHRPIMSKCHGAWGAGVLITSGLGVVAIKAGLAPTGQFWVLLAVLLASTAVLVRPMQQCPPRALAAQRGARRIALPDRVSFLLMGFALCGIVLEVIARNWSVIYLRDALGAVDWVAALALPAFMVMQTAGRFVADEVVVRIGEVRLGRALALISAAGLALLVGAGSIPTALLACALMGLGSSAIFPMSMSALARRTQRPASESLAGFSILQNLAFIAAPSLFGVVAGAMDLRIAMALLLPLPFVALYYSRALQSPAGTA